MKKNWKKKELPIQLLEYLYEYTYVSNILIHNMKQEKKEEIISTYLCEAR